MLDVLVWFAGDGLVSFKRKLLAAREDLAEKIAEIASRRKWTLYELVNEVLEEAIKADSIGVSLREVVDERGVLKDARDSGFLLVPARLWYDLIDKAYTCLDEEWMRSLWYECGQWYGKYYGDLERFSGAVKRIFWDLSEFDLSMEGDSLVVRCIILNLQYPYADLLSKFIEGALSVFGYERLDGEVSRGVINLKFRKMT
ncbi:MAG: hypothetical protein QXU55_07245 [Candidatus Bathyarchaeia archaeon]